MKKYIWILYILLFLVSCAKPTPIPEPTPIPSPTPILLSEIDLEPIVIQAGDLPAGFTGAQISHYGKNIYGSVNDIKQELANNNQSAGFIEIYLFGDLEKAEKIFTSKTNSLGKSNVSDISSTTVSEIPDVGEKATSASSRISFFGLDTYVIDFVFIRCSAFVNIRFSDTSNTQSVINYAKRLDERLSKLICR